ncbi:heterokaryon incompatibility protein-domain-containing protein [Biscogniauxia mediterranea]|nr:heterokaryon incompatibility protein-domain-containing protein [Biscogniauxia mediterranea]
MAGEASSDLRPFEYDPLLSPSHIRLLKRLGEADDGTLCFSLTSHDIGGDTRIPYCCLSYTWGNPFAHGTRFRQHFDAVDTQYAETSKVRVHIDGRVMHIQRNLHDALSMIPQNTFAEYANRPLDNTHGQTYLHIAAGAGRPANIETWLRCGADVNKLDDEGHNGLHYAAGNGKHECVPILLQNGCQRDVKDINGATPIDLARAAGHDQVVALLEESSLRPESEHGDAQGPISPVQETVPIWVDAICINQTDVDEKSAQVTMMDRVYSVATYVVAWLGPPDEHSDVGIQTLNKLQSHLKEFRESGIEPFSGKDKEKYAEAGVPYVSRQQWVGLASLFQRQWFRRAWIVQEAVLPEALLVYLGGNSIPWRHLGQVSEAIRYQEAKLGTATSTSFNPVQDAAVPVVWNMAEVSKWRRLKTSSGDRYDTAEEHRKFFTLPHLVYNFWTFMASDPRDKVFAYYGFLNLFAAERRQTDYRLPLATVYTMATREIIENEGNLQVLSACVYHMRRRDGLPSWVPDFSLPGINAIPGNFSADRGLEYIAPKTTGPADGGLHVRGSFVGVVSEVGGRPGTRPGEKLLFDPSWLTMVLSLRGKGGYGESPNLSSILWTTLCMDMSSGGLFEPDLYGAKAPDKQGIEFRYFMLLLILAAGDGKIREKLGLEMTTKYDLIFSHLDYDPMVEDMEPVLADLDAFEEHDGKDQCWLPSRAEVLRYWNDFRCGLLRNTEVDSDSGPIDYHLPAGVQQENSRPIGNGHVMLQSKMARQCVGFISAYMSMYGGRHLITVNDRYLGLASVSVKLGDEVWILPGLNAPAVLRPVVAESKSDSDAEGGVPRYEFFGSCYISGMMHGGLADSLKSGLQDIELV